MLNDLRAQILGNADGRQPALALEVPEWNVVVHLRRITLGERLAFEAKYGAVDDLDRKKEPEKHDTWLLGYVIACACDAEGHPLFTDEDAPVLRTKSVTAIQRISLAAMRLNVVTAEEVAELGKRSSGAPNGVSPSASPVTST